MRGDRFSIFGEFRSFCKIWTNSYGIIYRDRKNHLRLSSLDYPPRFYVPYIFLAVSKTFLFLSNFLRKLQVWFQKFQVANTLVLLTMQFCLFSVLLAHFPFLFSCRFAFFRYWCLSFETWHLSSELDWYEVNKKVQRNRIVEAAKVLS